MARAMRASMTANATRIAEAHFTAKHSAYRDYLERQRVLMVDVAILLEEDAARAASWHRGRTTGHGVGHWIHKFFLGLMVRGHGKNAAEAVTEAAKSIIQMSLVHGEYMLAERAKGPVVSDSATAGRPGRYRTGSA